jgi:hypothetical protein
VATLPRVTHGRRLGSLVAVLALFGVGVLLASCGGDDSATTVLDTTMSIPPVTTETTTTTETMTQPPPGPTEIRVVVVNGAPKGGIVRETVDKDDRVVLIVRSDVSDQVHLHGYDVMRDVAPGSPARLPFKATIPGRFEVELEDRALQIADITVQP